MNRILLVEDSTAIRQLLVSCIESIDNIEVEAVATQAEAVILLEDSTDFLCAVLDLNLPDSPNGEVVEMVERYNIPIVILTGSLESAVQRTLHSNLVIDYITKRDINEIERVTTTVRNLYNNQTMKVLAVDDSRSFRDYMVRLLTTLRYSVITAENGEEALRQLAEHPDVSLVISDFNMPKMDGVQLVQEMRKKHRREEVAFLGLSSQGDDDLITRFLKSGANDYMRKPLVVDEFYCRVLQSTNAIAHLRTIKDAATSDFLTRVHNRRSLFETGERIYDRARNGHHMIAAIMVDADHFKQINDTYGHDAGDRVLIKIADIIKNAVRPNDLVARFGGEEFACLVSIKTEQDAMLVCERIRIAIESEAIDIGGQTISVTVSIGATCKTDNSFEDMLKIADQRLYEAKEMGRNRSVAA